MRIDHIQLAFPPGEIEKFRQYFIGVWGMIEDERPSSLDNREGAWFRKGHCIIHVGVDLNFIPQKKAHVAIIVDDIDSFAGNLSDNGYEVRWNESIDVVKRFFTDDPFGNRIEIIRDGDSNLQKFGLV